MIKYIIVRLIWIFILIFALLSFLFIATRIITIYAWSGTPPFNEVSTFVIDLYFKWLKAIFTEWDWGYSIYYVRVPVWDMFLQKVPVTLKLNALAFIIYVPIGILLGIISATRKNKRLDNFIGVVTVFFMSIPHFVFLLLIIILFSFYLDWLPSTFPAKDVDTNIQYTGLILPIFALCVGPIANITRLVRGELTEILDSPFLVLARTKGLTKTQTIFRHGLRNSMVPVIPMIIFNFVTVLSGSFIIEIIYAIPGAARLFLTSLTYPSFDYNMLFVCALFFSSFSFVSILLIDITYHLIDPRIKMGSKKAQQYE